MKTKIKTNEIVDDSGKVVGILRTWFNHKQCVFTEEVVITFGSTDIIAYTDGTKILRGPVKRCCSPL